MQELTYYNAAKQALAQAASIDEVKDVKDKAAAMRLYAHQQNNDELEKWASQIKLRAMRKIGELSREIEKSYPDKGHGAGLPAAGKTKEQALDEANISTSQAHRCEQLAQIPEEKFEERIAQGATVTELLREKKHEENAALPKVELPEGQYDVIVIDPPWPMEKIERDVAPNQVAFEYPTMTEQEIFDFYIGDIIAPDCHLFMWTTQKFLPLSLRVLEAWGFRYVFTMTWMKNGGFQPFNLPQYNTEFVLYARQGTPKFIDTKNFFTGFQAKRRAHSQKPDEFYDTIRRVTHGKRIDIFSREKREGFDQHGNESTKFSEDRKQTV